MKPGPVEVVPAGKKPNIKKPIRLKQLFNGIRIWFRAKKMRGLYFVMATSLAVIAFLIIQGYMSNYVYVVLIDGKEVGIVGNAREIEKFIAEITDRCGDLYKMNIAPADNITLVREYRPNSEPQTEAAQTAIRQKLTLMTEAYMITVDGAPLVPVYAEEDLTLVVESLKDNYSNKRGVKVLDTFIVEELNLERCTVDPETVLKAEEVVSLLVGKRESESLQAAVFSDYSDPGTLGSRQSFSYDEIVPFAYIAAEIPFVQEKSSNTNNAVHVKTVEEVTVIEIIPFSTEYLYSDEMWVVQKEITIPGIEGKQEYVYHITRENGVEIERTKVRETILEQPVTQVETHGTVKVPSMGTGQFIWPVENGGEVTPGRGFSSWHTGIDIHATSGTNILAADSGVVWFSGRGGSQGLYLIIYHGSFWTLYLHNSANLVSEGAAVSQGNVIARVGSTGRSTGPHLHFEVRLDDGSGEWHTYYQHEPIDPLKFFKP